MKRSKLAARCLITSLVLCMTLAVGLLISSQIALATANPVKGIGVVVKKNPGGGKGSNARTNENGQFTLGNLEPGSYTVSFKHADYSPPANLQTLVVRVEGVKGGKVEKRFPISQLRSGVIFDIEIERGSILMGTCMATDERSEE